MNRINRCFSDNAKKLIAFTVVCDPDYLSSLEIVYELIENGADMIELGIPFSDPVADGPVIQAAYQRAGESGFVVDKAFEMVNEIRRRHETPLMFLTYYNIIYRYGAESFLKRCSKVSLDGLIIPDLPYEEQDEIAASANYNNINIIPMVSLTSGDRMKRILRDADEFIYCVSSMGVTGRRDHFREDIIALADMISVYTKKKKAVGFGITAPEHIAQLKDHFDGVIVGSAFVELAGRYKPGESGGEIGKLAARLKNELLCKD